MPLVSLENVFFSYGKAKIIEDLSWDIEPGDFWYLKGRNGSGKSTLLKIIAGLLSHSNGQITLDLAHTPSFYSPEIGCYHDLTVKQNLSLFSAISDQDEQLKSKLIDLLEIGDLYSKKYSNLSHGQKFRVLLFRAFSQVSDLYLLDEPIEGLDVFYLKQLASILALLAGMGKSVILVSHLLPDDWRSLPFKETMLETGCLYSV